MSFSRIFLNSGIVCWVLLVLVNSLFLNGCDDFNKKDKKIVEGEILVKKYCTSCHTAVSPQMLDKETWRKSILPAMGEKLGISMWSGQYFPEDMRSGISLTDWQKIVDYFSENAPDKLPQIKFSNPAFENTHFKIMAPAVYDTSKMASTTLVKFNPGNNSIYTADVLSQKLYRWDLNLAMIKHQLFESPVVDITFNSEKKRSASASIVTLIGSINPDDNPRGKIRSIRSDISTEGNILATSLPRPVKSLTADFDKNGLEDILVCGFGNNSGGLYWLKQNEEGEYEKIQVADRPGAIQAYVGDYNRDGWPDIMSLYAQGDEGIWMYLNDKKGFFKSVNVLRFSPLFGSSSFQVVDFNNDGHEDILYTSGDNSDYSRILKPYHGIYIFMNNGKNSFKQTYFHQVNGSTKAVAADLNNDGRLDLATIAFFSNTKDNPRESFMYFIQHENLKFKIYSLPIERLGKWLCMDVNDIDNDGDPDIILGNFSIRGFNQPGVKATWDTKLPFIVLKNQINTHKNSLQN